MNHANEYLKVTVTQGGFTSEASSLRQGHKEGKDHFIFPLRISQKPPGLGLAQGSLTRGAHASKPTGSDELQCEDGCQNLHFLLACQIQSFTCFCASFLKLKIC